MAEERQQPRTQPTTSDRVREANAAQAATDQQAAAREAAAAQRDAEASGEQPLDEIHFDQGQGYEVAGKLVDAEGNPVGEKK